MYTFEESDEDLRARINVAYGMWGAFLTTVKESRGKALDDCAQSVNLTRGQAFASQADLRKLLLDADAYACNTPAKLDEQAYKNRVEYDLSYSTELIYGSRPEWRLALVLTRNDLHCVQLIIDGIETTIAIGLGARLARKAERQAEG